jgi:hypothetical protein
VGAADEHLHAQRVVACSGFFGICELTTLMNGIVDACKSIKTQTFSEAYKSTCRKLCARLRFTLASQISQLIFWVGQLADWL